METSFAKLLAGLAARNIRFILVGGLAVDLCGFHRSTFDVDVLVEDDPENLTRLLEYLGAFGSGAARDLSLADFTAEEGCIRVLEDFPIDLFTRMAGQTYADLLPLTFEHPVLGLPVKTLNAQGLIRLKQNSVREKDRIDVDFLRSLPGNPGSSGKPI